MTAELIIAEVVREWVERAVPGDPATAHAAARYAVESFTAGASVTEACEEARRMAICRSHHPSSMAASRGHLPAAS